MGDKPLSNISPWSRSRSAGSSRTPALLESVDEALKGGVAVAYVLIVSPAKCVNLWLPLGRVGAEIGRLAR